MNAETLANQGYGRNESEKYRLTADEIRALKQCNQEGIASTGIPLGVISGGLMYYGIKSGKIKPTFFGTVPMVISTGFSGFFLARLWHGLKCARKIIEQPNSSYRQYEMRMKGEYRGNLHNPQTNFPRVDDYKPAEESKKEYHQSVGTDLDMASISSYDPLPPSYNDKLGRTDETDAIDANVRYSSSYSDYRRQNRKDYIDKMWDNDLPAMSKPHDFKEEARAQPEYQIRRNPQLNGRTQEFGTNRKTKYGDDME